MCFSFSPGKRETHKQFDPHPFSGQSREVVYVYCFCAPRYRGAKCATLKTAGKTAEKGAEWEWVPVKQPKNSQKEQPKHPKNSCFDCFSGVSAVCPAVFRLFDRDPLGTFFGCFSGCFQCRAFGTSVDGHRDCKSCGKFGGSFAEFFWTTKSRPKNQELRPCPA